MVQVRKERGYEQFCRYLPEQVVQLVHNKVVSLRMVEGARDEYVVHGSLRLDAQFKGNIREPVCPDDVVAVDHDAGSIETAFLFVELALDCEPEQVVTKAICAVEEMH